MKMLRNCNERKKNDGNLHPPTKRVLAPTHPPKVLDRNTTKLLEMKNEMKSERTDHQLGPKAGQRWTAGCVGTDLRGNVNEWVFANPEGNKSVRGIRKETLYPNRGVSSTADYNVWVAGRN